MGDGKSESVFSRLGGKGDGTTLDGNLSGSVNQPENPAGNTGTGSGSSILPAEGNEGASKVPEIPGEQPEVNTDPKPGNDERKNDDVEMIELSDKNSGNSITERANSKKSTVGNRRMKQVDLNRIFREQQRLQAENAALRQMLMEKANEGNNENRRRGGRRMGRRGRGGRERGGRGRGGRGERVRRRMEITLDVYGGVRIADK